MYKSLLSVLLLTSIAHGAENNELTESPATTVSTSVSVPHQANFNELPDDLIKHTFQFINDQESLLNLNMTSKKFQNFIQEGYKQIILRVNFLTAERSSLYSSLQFDLFYHFPGASSEANYFLRNVKMRSNGHFTTKMNFEKNGTFTMSRHPIYQNTTGGTIFIPRQLLNSTAQLMVKLVTPVSNEILNPNFQAGQSIFHPASQKTEERLVLEETGSGDPSVSLFAAYFD